MPETNISKLRTFVKDFAGLLETASSEPQIIKKGKDLLEKLVETDDWLPEPFTRPDNNRYQQYLLHVDSLERFSIVSFVWGPGQTTPVHNHTVWGLIGMLRGEESSQNYHRRADGRLVPVGEPVLLKRGQVEAVSPGLGDIHKVSNASADSTSISIHVYGGNIGAVKRSVFYEDGSDKLFISGYNNNVLPNIWDRSKEII